MRVFIWITAFLVSIPLLVMIVYSFNRAPGRFNYRLNEFSLHGWLDPFGVPQLFEALSNSVLVALCAAAATAVLGTIASFVLTRKGFPAKQFWSMFTFIPLATPEIILGAGLLSLFVSSAALEPFASILPEGLLYPLGISSVMIAHITFGIGYVIVTTRTRFVELDSRFEEAAADLGASSATVFRTVTFPLVWPSVLSGSLLVFALSLDDFVLTNFTAGNTPMFPTWLFGLLRRQLPTQVDVVGVILFLIASVSMLGSLLIIRSVNRARKPG
ncbi:ABC transporter permease [Leucobacter sp. wl10]|uniref:ABC transporter permease n=1 Tax=Leucobacter sp. wl10 TaxID=2304677 RepID=UPI0013C2FCE7|nr:ABC transporter permease subunit [Leucobacter sp. wl10]